MNVFDDGIPLGGMVGIPSFFFNQKVYILGVLPCIMVNRSCRIAFKKYVQRQKRIDKERKDSIKKGYEDGIK